MGFLAFDVETGGLSPERHALTQIAAVACTGEGEGGRATIVEQIALPVRPLPYLQIEDEALAVQGHTRASLAARPLAVPEREVTRLFLRWLEGLGEDWHEAPLVAHNAAFDAGFLLALLRRTGGDLRERPLLCTLERQKAIQHRGQIPKGSLKLRDCVERLGLSQAEAHEALADATLAAHLFVWQEGQQAAWRRQALELEEGDAEADGGDVDRRLGYLWTIGYRSPSVVLSPVSASTRTVAPTDSRSERHPSDIQPSPAPPAPVPPETSPVPTRPGVTFGLGAELLALVRDAQAGALPDLPGIQAPGTRQRVGEMNAFVVGTLCLIRRHVEDLSYLETAVREHRKGQATDV